MALADDLAAEVARTFKIRWREDAAHVVPAPKDLTLDANHAKYFESATVVYADLDGSTNMVDTLFWEKAAEIYKTYLRSASLIIKAEGGSITAYDGDRVMGVFTDDSKHTSAVRAAMKINRAVREIIRPAFAEQYAATTFDIKHVIGVDTSALRAARVGVRGDNDLTWVGSAANHAAKLTALSKHPIWITSAIYDNMSDVVKYKSGTSSSANMWTKYKWNTFNNADIFGTDYQWHSI